MLIICLEKLQLLNFDSWSLSRRYTLKLLAETCVQRRTRPVSRSGVTRWNSCFFTTATVASRCRSRKRFYFSWNLSRNGSSKKFHETDHVTRCNACWNLFRSAVAHKFQLKVSACNGGFRVVPKTPKMSSSFILVLVRVLLKTPSISWT